MEITREIELDSRRDDVWALLADRDELASWLGADAALVRDLNTDGDRVTWTWDSDGFESTVELTVVDDGASTRVRVVERGAARACALGDAWDDRLLGLELRCLTLRFVSV